MESEEIRGFAAEALRTRFLTPKLKIGVVRQCGAWHIAAPRVDLREWRRRDVLSSGAPLAADCFQGELADRAGEALQVDPDPWVAHGETAMSRGLDAPAWCNLTLLHPMGLADAFHDVRGAFDA